jgi:tetratricopeptide (TPR) repeat protein
MRILLACPVLLALTQMCPAAENDRPDLKSLYDARRWFDLRDAVTKGAAPVFYQGAVACAFNDLHRCEKNLRAAIKSRPQSDEAVEAHRTLASAYLRQGKYREALAQVDAVLALRPGDSDAGNVRPLLATLSEFPDQEVVRRPSTTLKLHDEGLPISINRVQATYWFDTGANYSILSESDAKRFGLAVRAVSTKIGVSTGARVDSRVAVAPELSIGSTRLRHVAFLVFPDDQPPFNEGTPGSRGLIGIPVLLGFQRFVWGADRKFEIGSKSLSKHVPHADLCFDGNTPVTQIQFGNRSLAFILDTGATNTDLYPPFAAEFPDLIRTSARTNSYKTEGVGSAKYMDAATLASLHFSIGGFPVVLSPANALLTHTNEASKFFEGNLGIDLLQQAHKTIFDFKAMTLTLQ